MHLGHECLIAESSFDVGELAVVLEERGFESFWLGEHDHMPVGSRQPSKYAQRWNTAKEPQPLPESYRRLPDPFVSLAVAATRTTTLKLGTGVALVLEHHPLTLAKTVATLDQVSAGRVVLGVGVGWNRQELASHSELPWSKRYGALVEHVQALRTLWVEDEPSFEGTFFRFDPAWSYPKPVQNPHPPVLFPGTGPLGMQLAAEWSDGWMPLDDRLEDVGDSLATFRKLVREAGRDDVEVTLCVRLLRDRSGRWPSVDVLKQYRDLGVHRVVLIDDSTHIAGRKDRMRMLDSYAAAIPDLA